MERYVPQHSPSIEALERELWRIKATLDALIDGQVEVLRIAPTKPSIGQRAFADGTQWNPGNGRGLYMYDGTSTASASWRAFSLHWNR